MRGRLAGAPQAGMCRRMPPPAPSEPPSEPLWDWSLRTMQGEEARRALLALQDGHGLNGSLMLWAAWCDRAGLCLAEEDARRIIASVHEMDRYVVRRLREVRRYAASPRPGYDAPALAALRREVYEAELAAERLIQARLEADTLAVCAPRGGDDETGPRLARLCARALESPVLLADDLGESGPFALFATLMAHAPALRREEAG